MGPRKELRVRDVITCKLVFTALRFSFSIEFPQPHDRMRSTTGTL